MSAAAARLPLLGHTSPDAVFAWAQGGPISVRRFLQDARHLAGLLGDKRPGGRYVLNGCADHYRFCVGLAAALINGQVSVLPHNHVLQTLIHLADTYPGVFALIDDGDPPDPLPYLRYPGTDGPTSDSGSETNSGHGSNLGAGTDSGHRSNPDATPDPGAAADWHIPAFDPDQLAAILFTSGSTGTPQALPRDWGTIVASARAEALRLGMTPQQPYAVLATVPAQHSYGFESAIWLPMLAGGIVAARRPFYPSDVFAALTELPAPRLLVTSPVHLRAMLSSPTSPPPVETVMSATAPLPADLAHMAEREFGGVLVEIYGSTETGQVASRQPTRSEVWQTLPGVVFEQHDEQTYARDGHVGAACALADRIELLDAEHFNLLGRFSDLVNVAGRRGSVTFIERQLLSIDGIVDAAILVAEDSQDTRARVTGFVVAPASLTNAQIVAQLRTRIDAVFVPRPLYRVDHLPRDGNGKLPRQRLLDLAALLAKQASDATASARKRR